MVSPSMTQGNDPPKREHLGHPTWEFSSGKWSQLESDPLAEFAGENESWDAVLRKAGYSICALDAPSDDPGATIHEASYRTTATERYPFIVDLDFTCGYRHQVYVASLPDLLQLLPQVSGWRTAWALDQFVKTIDDIARKSFHAWHGHRADGICHECDPEGVKYREQRRREAAAKKAGAQK